MKSNKNILIILSGSNFVRNYITTDAFADIEKAYDCSYLVSDSVNSFAGLKEESVLKYHIDNKVASKHYQLFNVLMWRYQSKSSSFKFRTLRLLSLNLQFPSHYGWFQKSIRWLLRIARNIYLRAMLSLCGSRILFPLYFCWKKNKLQANSDINNAIADNRPVLVLMPSSAYEPEGIDAARICAKLNIPLLFLVDNWDNLSSKSILWSKPSHIGVWGKQSVEHAVGIQGFTKEQVTCLGTPRFDQYFQQRNSDLRSKFDFKYILFVGTALAFDEASVLQKLNEIISGHSDIFRLVKIIYRPHPWRQGNDSIAGKHLDNVLIDPQMLKAYADNDSSRDIQPDLSYYPSLLKNAEFVIGGLTSMLIEALIFRKRFMALVYDDGKNLTSQHNVYKYYTHFRGLSSVEAISFCDDIDKLQYVFIDTWMARSNVNEEKVDLQRRYFYFDDGRTYSQRLSDLCNVIMDKPINADRGRPSSNTAG